MSRLSLIHIYGSVRALSLYDSGSAFADEQWVLIGMQEKDTMFAFTHRIQGMLYTSTAISLVAGILGCLLYTSSVGIDHDAGINIEYGFRQVAGESL